MSFTTWILLAIGALLIYSAVKGQNPVALIAGKLGTPTKQPAKLRGI